MAWAQFHILQNETKKWNERNQQSHLSDAEVEVGVELVDHALVLDYLRSQQR